VSTAGDVCFDRRHLAVLTIDLATRRSRPSVHRALCPTIRIACAAGTDVGVRRGCLVREGTRSTAAFGVRSWPLLREGTALAIGETTARSRMEESVVVHFLLLLLGDWWSSFRRVRPASRRSTGV